MTLTQSEVRHGAYYDSIVLMQLQAALARLPGVVDAGVAMATEANQALLAANDLVPNASSQLGPDDLLVVVKAEDDAAAQAALAQVEGLLARRRQATDEEFRPRSLEGALKLLPAARWVSVSVPGRYAAAVGDRALELGRSVFLYSDNVSLADEVALKAKARAKGLLVLGPDCGTALVDGVGLGFTNRVRRGPVGLVGASGTGLQAVSTGLHGLGSGVSHALGTGGRDLAAEVGGETTLQALHLLAEDPATRVIVLVSKPPSPAVTSRVLAQARATGKPVVVCLLGSAPPQRRLANLTFAAGLEEAARLAVEVLGGETPAPSPGPAAKTPGPDPGGSYLRGLFAGGTLAYETLLQLRLVLAPLYSNTPVPGVEPLADVTRSQAHTVLDLGADEFTQGRLHPMIDQDLRRRRLLQEASDPAVGVLLFDVVLGYGAHRDPAAELDPVLREIRRRRPELGLGVVLVGTEDDPQDASSQRQRLTAAGAHVFSHTGAAVDFGCRHLTPEAESQGPAPAPQLLDAGAGVINLGLESFYDSLRAQGAQALHVEWRPPAGGNEKLMAILAKMKG